MQIPTTFQTAGPFNLGGGEIVVIAVVFLVLFGGKKLPEMAKGLGEGIRNFKQAVKEPQEEAPPATTEPKKPAV
jgi:sec-independent protein translocase protein TatA